MRDKRILVHADGGLCHGTPLVNNRCLVCGIMPDTQSTELWEPHLVRLAPEPLSVRVEGVRPGGIPRIISTYRTATPRQMFTLMSKHMAEMMGRFTMRMLDETTVEVVVE